MYFNPRTPCGVRLDADKRFVLDHEFQSTHPMRGATSSPSCRLRLRAHFNPRTPCGVRRRPSLLLAQPFQFQSTHPMRGATKIRIKNKLGFRLFQSTHPMRGATFSMSPSVHSQGDFNPRTPCGVRLLTPEPMYSFLTFQSTHPMRGATYQSWLLLK